MAQIIGTRIPTCGMDGCSRLAVNNLAIRYPRTGTEMLRPRCHRHSPDAAARGTLQCLLVGSVVSLEPVPFIPSPLACGV